MFDSLALGTRGVMASQLALNVTGQNITNANTEGYSRKRLNLDADWTRTGAFGELGIGVDVDRVQRMRDEFVEMQVRSSITDEAYLDEKDTSLRRVENIFNEPTDTGLNSVLNKFWNSWQDVANNPGDLSAREALRSTTKIMTGTMHALSGELRDYKLTMNDHLANLVGEVNRISGEIAILNKGIVVAESGVSGEANDSRDRRDALVAELAEYIPIDVIEDELGAFTITTAGNIVVSPDSSFNLEVYRETVDEGNGFNYSQVRIRHSLSNDEYDGSNGRLASVINVRDEIIPKYENYLDEIAGALVREVNIQHRQGFNLDENTGIHFFDPDQTNAAGISLSEAIERSALNIAAATGTVNTPANETFDPTTIAAIPSINERVLDLKGVNGKYNDILQDSLQIILDDDGNLATTNDQTTLREGIGADYVVDYQNGMIRFFNYTTRFNNPGEMLNITFEYQDQAFSGEGDGENALAIAQLREKYVTEPDTEGNYTQSVGEFYSSMIGSLGVERNEVKSSLETTGFILEQLQAEQQQVSGVSLDEEMANMIRFENTYQASAKFISTVDQMLEILMGI